MEILLKNFFAFLFILIPLSLITGPAIPDITITLGGVFSIIWFFIKKDFSLINNNFVRISIIFWLSLIIISFFAIDKLKSFQDSIIYLRYILIPISIYFLLFNSEKILKFLFLIILILVFFVSIDTLFQFFNYSSEYGFGSDLLGFKSNWYGRLTGPFGDELIPGSYVSKFGLIGLIYFFINKNLTNKKIIQSLYLSLILVVCFVSGERMALATYSLALIVLLILKNYRSVIITSIIFSLISILMIYKFHPFYNDYEIIESNQYHQGLKIEKSFNCENDTSKVCTKIINIQPSFFEIINNFPTSAYGEIYLLSYKMFKDNPITGIGISNFKKVCEKNIEYKKMMVNYDCASHPHNTYIQWLTEGGLIALVLFVVYLFYLCKFIIYNNGSYEFKIISIVLLLILFWPIMSTGSLIKNWYGVSTYFIIGISMCISKIKIDD